MAYDGYRCLRAKREDGVAWVTIDHRPSTSSTRLARGGGNRARTCRRAPKRMLRDLEEARWIATGGVSSPDTAAAGASEDDFDALLTAAALGRHFVERAPLSCWLVDPLVEGEILGTGLLEMPAPR